MLTQSPDFGCWKWPKTANNISRCSSSLFSVRCSSSFSAPQRPIRHAVLGAGFAGLSVAWNLLQHGPKESHIHVHIYDEVGIGGGASGVAGGLLHPYSPKVKLLWRGEDLWKESLYLLDIAERALINEGKGATPENSVSPIIRRRGILRPAVNMKHIGIMTENAQNCLANCRIELVHDDAAQKLVPNLSISSNMAFYMPEALNINAQNYLQGLYLACENLANDMSTSGHGHRKLNFHQESVESLRELAGDFDAVVVCFGARTAFLPELCGKLPLRTCRGIIAQLQLGDDVREEIQKESPSILSDAWLAVHGGRHMDLGSTWDWNSINHSRDVGKDEASKAIEALFQKACLVYPPVKNWRVNGAVGGLRAMPPLTEYGSLPIIGSLDEFVDAGPTCKYWLFTGLGARGLLFHGWFGRVLAQAVLACDEGLLPHQLTSWKCS
ncbi:FAD-dependent oxidoreductase family protein [Striga asiatica]|uniref:FAD-dependent oxidoreductase family protein n=1 Tax=Striga asiatica TaxID=4170 RepID=A0A5A7QG29_STRAF|nr:FAD-dependent oxidoreductase family protein [Striga asiatica]